MFSAVLLIVLVMTNFLFDQSPFAAAYGLIGIVLIVGNLNMLVAPQSMNIKGAIGFGQDEADRNGCGKGQRLPAST